MIQHVNSTIRKIQPAEAVNLQALVNAEYQRKFNRRHAEKLAELMTREQFLTGHIVIATVNRRELCVNGQHQLAAIVASKSTVRCLFERYKCTTPADYVRLFHSYDTDQRMRTMLDSAEAFRMGRQNELPDASARMLNQFRAGLEFLNSGAQPQSLANTIRHDRFDPLTEMRDELEFYLWLDKQKECREVLTRAPIIACVIATCRRNTKRARQFWVQVVTGYFDESEHDKRYAPMKLNRYLRNVATAMGGASIKRGHHQTRTQMYVACVRCWNAYSRNAPLTHVVTITKGDAVVPELET